MKLDYGPLVTAAHGRFQGMVFAVSRGIPLVRRFSPPSNPRTVNQVTTRDSFRQASRAWAKMPAIARNPWKYMATGAGVLDRNAFIGFWQSVRLDMDASTIDAPADVDIFPDVGLGIPPAEGLTVGVETANTIPVEVPALPAQQPPTAGVMVVLAAIPYDKAPTETDAVVDISKASGALGPAAYNANMTIPGVASGTHYAVHGAYLWTDTAGVAHYVKIGSPVAAETA